MTSQPSPIIDTHVHFWDLEKGNYHWLKSENPPFWPDKIALQRNFLPIDLVVAGDLTLQGIVHIEAGFDNRAAHREVEWLGQIVEQLPCPLAIVPCVDLLQSPIEFERSIKSLKNYPAVVGVRHILDEAAVDILAQPQVQTNASYLAGLGLLFEAQFILADPKAVTAICALACDNPNLIIVLNHLCFSAAMNDVKMKQRAIQQLAACPNIVAKASGWEMIDSAYRLRHIDDFKRDLHLYIKAFGEDRIMLASNFPLCTLAKSYQQVWLDYANLGLTAVQQHKCFYTNAKRIYFND